MFCNLRWGKLDLQEKPLDEVKLFLPVLCRIILSRKNKDISSVVDALGNLHHETYDVIQLLKSDFSEILSDALKEQKLRQKASSRREDSVLIQNIRHEINEVFAGSNCESKARIVASELIYLQNQNSNIGVSSELLSCEDYKEYLSYIICILCSKIPHVFDVIKIITMLLKLTDSKHYIDMLVYNNPERYEEIIHHFITLFTNNKPSAEQKVLENLKMIINLSDESKYLICLPMIKNIRKRLMIAGILDKTSFEENLDVIVTSLFSMSSTNDLVDYVKSEGKAFEKFLRFSDLREKLFVMLANTAKRKSDCPNNDIAVLEKTKDEDSFYCSFLDETLQEDLRKATEAPEINTKETLTREKLQYANSLLILYLNLVNTCKMSLNGSEAGELVNLISHKITPDTEYEAELFIKLSLALFMSTSSISAANKTDMKIRAWLSALLHDSKIVSGKGGEILLSVGMHLHSGSYELIGPLLTESVGIPITVSASHAATVQTLWSSIQSEEQIVNQLGNVPIVEELSGDVTGYLPIHCISQILNSRTPSCPRNLFTWLPRQLKESREPVHPILCDLIGGGVKYLMSVKGRSSCVSGILEEDLVELLKPYQHVTCRVLSFYYLLLYRNSVGELKHKTEAQRGTAPIPHNYSIDLLGQDYAKTLLLHIKRNRAMYTAIYPVFLRLLISQFPYFCESQDLLLEEEADENISKLYENDKDFNVTAYLQTILAALKLSQESKAFYMITKMLQRYHSDIPSNIVAQCIPYVTRLGFRLQSVFIKLWEKSAALHPQKTWLHSANILTSQKLSEKDYWSNVILLFQAPQEIISTTAGIRILLHIIQGYLSLCNARITEVDPLGGKKPKEHQDNKTLFLTLQNSAVIQVLLDICDVEEADRDKSIDASVQHEINALIYNFIHDFFIKNDGLSKLVCWQTFKFSQVEGVVNGIPSIHVTSKFTGPLLQQGSLQKQLFSTCLLSYLSVQYPIPQTLDSCNEMIQWALSQTGELSSVWTVLSLPSLLRIASTFPPLVDKITQLLVHQKKIVLSLDIPALVSKIRMYSETVEDKNFNPVAVIDEAFENLMRMILAQMKGT